MEELRGGVRESEVVDLFSNILASSHSGQVVTEYIINATIKLTTRLQEPAQVERLRRLLETYQTNINVEIQQRAVEYGGLFGYDQVRRGVVEKMPPPEIREEQRVLGEAAPSKSKNKNARSQMMKKKQPAPVTEQDMLLDLMGDTGMPPPPTLNGHSDLLSDIMGNSSAPASQTSMPSNNLSSIMDLIDSTPSANQPSNPASSGGSADSTIHTAFNNNDLVITFQVNRSAAAVQLLARFRNSSMFDTFKDVKLQAAVPKSQKLQLQPISSSELGEGQEATQQMRIASAQGGVSPRKHLTFHSFFDK